MCHVHGEAEQQWTETLGGATAVAEKAEPSPIHVAP